MNKKKILIVDDVASNIHMLTTMLKDEYSIVAAKDGRKAIELANKEQQPDLILLDILMPDITGYEVCSALKKQKETRHIPIIFVSSLNDNEEHEKVLACGGDDYLAKPVTRKELYNKIQMQLRLGNYIQNTYNICKGSDMKNEKPKVLIVDDAPENIQVAVEVLKHNYTVNVATSGQKALSLLEDGMRPDLILLDIIMPEIDGFEVCTKLKENSEFNNIPIIFLTVLENESDMVKGLELGAVDYVVKPFEPKVLKARVDTHIKLKKYQDNLVDNLQEKEDILINQSKLATLGEMFESITFQWKEPLSIISMVCSTIKLEQDANILTDESLTKLVSNIDKSVNQLVDTVHDFGDFLISDNPKEYFKVKKVVKNTLKLLDSKLSCENITVNVELNNGEICNYRNDLTQVLMNLLTNSIQTLRSLTTKRTITITSEFNEKNYELTVSHNGGSVSPKTITSIVNNNFLQSEQKLSETYLFMCRKIIQDNMNGQFEVTTTDEDKKFKIILPIED